MVKQVMKEHSREFSKVFAEASKEIKQVYQYLLIAWDMLLVQQIYNTVKFERIFLVMASCLYHFASM